jgi:hypothetical protein
MSILIFCLKAAALFPVECPASRRAAAATADGLLLQPLGGLLGVVGEDDVSGGSGSVSKRICPKYTIINNKRTDPFSASRLPDATDRRAS